MRNKKELLERIEALESRKPVPLYLVYADGHTKRVNRIGDVLDAVCATPENGIVAIDWPGHGRNNLFTAIVESTEEDIDDLSLSLFQFVDESISAGRLAFPDLESDEVDGV